MGIIRKIALATFKDKKMLQVRTQKQDQVFFTLGGKPKSGESEIECLKREVGEEVGCSLKESTIKFLHEFEDVAHDKEGELVNIRMYEGELIGSPRPSSEVVEIGWFDTKSDRRNLSIIAQRTIFPWLKANGLIN